MRLLELVHPPPPIPPMSQWLLDSHLWLRSGDLLLLPSVCLVVCWQTKWISIGHVLLFWSTWFSNGWHFPTSDTNNLSSTLFNTRSLFYFSPITSFDIISNQLPFFIITCKGVFFHTIFVVSQHRKSMCGSKKSSLAAHFPFFLHRFFFHFLNNVSGS